MPIFCLLGFFAASQVPIGQPARLRSLLPNGSVVLVERRPDARSLTLQLFISARSTPETRQTHGYRHLLEHLEAKGRDGALDQRLESQAGLLTAETLRDATEYTVNVRPTDLKLGLETISSVIELGPVTKERIEREAKIINQELALEDVPQRLSHAAWEAAYGDDGLDPQGDIETIAHASPEALVALHKSAFVGPNLVLVVTGNVDLDAATTAAAEVLSSAPATPVAEPPRRTPRTATASGPRQAVAMPVGDFNSAETAVRLAAAFGLASQIEGSFVTYTPSQRGGLIIIGLETGGDMTGKLDGIKSDSVFGIGRTLARRWVEGQIGPESAGFMRGLLLVQGAGVRPENLTDNLRTMTVKEFSAAVEEFRGPKAVGVSL